MRVVENEMSQGWLDDCCDVPNKNIVSELHFWAVILHHVPNCVIL